MADLLSLSFTSFSSRSIERQYQRRLLSSAKALQNCFALAFVATVGFYLHASHLNHGVGAVDQVVSACAVAASSFFCLQLTLGWPVKTQDPSLLIGIARVCYVVLNCVVWSTGSLQQVPLAAVLRSPVLHMSVAGLTGRVVFDFHVVVQLASFVAVWWIFQVMSFARMASSALDSDGLLLQALLGLVLPTVMLYLMEMRDRKVFYRTLTTGGTQTVTSTPPLPRRRTVRRRTGMWSRLRTAFLLQPIPFSNRFMEEYHTECWMNSLKHTLSDVVLFSYECCVLLLLGFLTHQTPLSVHCAIVCGCVPALLALTWKNMYNRKREYILAASQTLYAVLYVGSTWLLPDFAQRLAYAGLAQSFVAGLVTAVRQGHFWKKMCTQVIIASITAVCFVSPWVVASASARAGALFLLLTLSIVVPVVIGYQWEVYTRWVFLARVLSRDQVQEDHANAATVQENLRKLKYLKGSLQKMVKGSRSDTQMTAVELCSFASNTVGGAEVLLCLGTMDYIFKMLYSHEEQKLLDGLRLLLSLAHESNEVLQEVVQQGGLDAMVDLANSTQGDVTIGLVYALAALANSHDVHVEVAEAGGLAACAALMKSSVPQLQSAALHTLMALMSCSKVQVMDMVEEQQVLQWLVPFMRSGIAPACHNACSAVAFAAISGHQGVCNQITRFGGIEALVARISNPFDPMAASAAAALASLAGSNEVYRQRVMACGAIPQLVKLMTHAPEEARAFAMYALEAVVTESDRTASAEFVGSQGVLPLMGMLTQGVGSRVEYSSNLLGNLYSNSPSLRRTVVAATGSRAPALDVLMSTGNANRMQAAAAQVMRDARLRSHALQPQGKGKDVALAA